MKAGENCYRIYNELIELIVPTDSGPGILHFGFVGKKNEFKNIQGFRFFAHPSLACARNASTLPYP